MNEVELKFLEIDIVDVERRLEQIGAQLAYETNIEEYAFLADGFDPIDSTQCYLRVRKTNTDATLTYKYPVEPGSAEREELEVAVSDAETTIELIRRLGFERGTKFQKHRKHYVLDDLVFELDTLSDVPTYLEIETQSMERMRHACDLLGLNMEDGKAGTIREVLGTA